METGARKWIITITVILAALLEIVDSTVVNVALTNIMGNLGATLEDVAWVVTAYAVANVIIVPMTGWLSAKFGRRNYFVFSIILFTVASFFCGQADNIWELVVFRFIQGLGGGALLSTSQSILIETFPKEELGMATALFGMGVIVGPTIGPTLGGFITDHYSWPWIFYINLPLGMIATFLALTYIKDSNNHRKVGANDWLGIFLLVLTIGSLQIFLERGEGEDWFSTPYITVLAFTSVVAGICFFWWELSTEHPVVDLRVLRNRSLSVGMIFTFILGFGLFASVFVLPIFLQGLLGFTAEQSGLLMMPGSLATAAMMPFIGTALKKKVPAQLLAAMGFFIFFFSTRMLSRSTLASGPDDFFWPLVIRGIGLSLLFVPLTTLAISPLKPKDVPQGTGLNNMMRQLGGSFGIAIMTTFIQQRAALHRVNLIPNISMFNNVAAERIEMLTRNFIAKGNSMEVARQMALKMMDVSVLRQSTLMADMDAFFVVSIFFLFCIPLLFFQKSPKSGLVVQESH